MITQDQKFHVVPRVDSLNPNSNSMVLRCTVSTTPNPLNISHWDFWQGIPRVEGKDNRQYVAAMLENIILANNTIDGRGTSLQCIFSVDGRVNNIIVTNNTLDTRSQHKITLGGVIRGIFTGNKDFTGKVVPAVLEPLRIGSEVYILSFIEPDDDYQDCVGDVLDYRRIPFRKKGTYLIDFDLQGFLDYTDKNLPDKGDGNTIARLAREAAYKFGTELIERVEEPSITEERYMKDFKLSKEGRDLLIEGEGIRGEVYRDINGNETIGIGHKVTDAEKESGTVLIGNKAIPIYGNVLTHPQIFQLFRQDISTRVAELNKLIADNNVDLEQCEFDALFDLYFNIGRDRFVNDATFWKRLVAGDKAGVPEAISWWNKSKGKFHQGMANRRARCIAVWEGYGSSQIPSYDYVSESNESNESDVVLAKAAIEANTLRSSAGLATPPREQDVDVEYHESQWDSSTIRSITFMAASALATMAVTKFGLPEGAEAFISEGIMELGGMLFTMYFANKARHGRIDATKRIKH